MSIELVSTEIRRFLASKEPETLCVTGAWGVGKTYAWKRYLDQAVIVQQVWPARYSYVSLFGQNSLADVRNSILENTVELSRPGQGVDVGSVKRWLGRSTRQAAKFGKLFPDAEKYAPFSERLLFAMLRMQLVCIDDVERAGDGLTAKDILGLVAQLREQKNCKVVLLLNQDKLTDDAKREFESQIEKVADVVLAFAPSPVEAIEIAIDPQTPFHEDLQKHTLALKIKNIRVIKRIERLCRHMEHILRDVDARVRNQALHTLVLGAFAKYQPDDAPPMALLRRYNEYGAMAEDADPANFRWSTMLSDYGLRSIDDFDSLILDGVDLGYFAKDSLQAKAKEKEAALALEDQNVSMQEAWDGYHDSFDDNQDAVLDAMAQSFRDNYRSVTPLNVSGMARLFTELGRAAQARELVEFYVANRDAPPEFWDLNNSSFRQDITDPTVNALFAQKFAALAPPPEDPSAILVRIGTNDGYSQRDVTRLAQLSANEFRDIFKRLRGKDLRRATTAALRFRTSELGSPQRTIGERADQALDMIAQESPINERRVRQHRSRV